MNEKKSSSVMLWLITWLMCYIITGGILFLSTAIQQKTFNIYHWNNDARIFWAWATFLISISIALISIA